MFYSVGGGSSTNENIEILDGFHVLESITSFADNVHQLMMVTEQSIPSPSLIDYFGELSQILSRIYALYFDLPDLPRDLYQPGSCYRSFCLDINLPDGLQLFLDSIEDSYEGTVTIQNWGDALEELLEELQAGALYYDEYLDTDDYRKLDRAVREWKDGFGGKYGWGTGLIKILQAAQCAHTYLISRKMPAPPRRERPTDYVFAHCVCDIPAIENHETVKAG